MEEQVKHPRRHNLEPFRDTGKMRRLRMWLNIAFMLIATAGMALYFVIDHEVAFWILIVATVFKFVELTLRLLKL
ncbi:hypothetical protein [Xylanibacter brevis]|jgi:hypothetical protein|uniref:hypothetical protein n=1 Tax=Xylanibacter brevis TaxID=83231 RepID=UPI0004829F7F|nr:hypothetical protein [Xylanibacter brevis]